MDIQQLKLLAGRVRGLLEQSHHSIGHNQSLDLIAALPGLRNWPEVQAFPDRVAACELEQGSAGRLAFRLHRKFDLDLSSQELLIALSPPGLARLEAAPQIWPTGPAPGVYITDSQEAINALLESYEEATDGALVYAERAGSHWEGSIDLGEGGLYSNGLQRVPSGTLIVVGPLELDQQSWSESAGHLEMACLIAQGSRHRVAVLLRTPTPESLCEDVHLMVRSTQPEGDTCEEALLGVVSAEGDLEVRQPFARVRPALKAARTVATTDAIPAAVRPHLEKALAENRTGLLVLGSSRIEDHAAIDLVSAALAMTDHAGPAARIMPRHRSTPAKDWLVPEAIKELPFLPSIESAYEQGYRRMIVAANYTPAEVLMDYSDDALLIVGTYGSNAGDALVSHVRYSSPHSESDLLEKVIAVLAVKYVNGAHGASAVSDLYVRQKLSVPALGNEDELLDLLAEHRLVRWQDELREMLRAGTITPAEVAQSLKRDHAVKEFLSQWEPAAANVNQLARP
ncbi:hypothetical protein [Acidovorax sp.]|uniref:hypothetical protein n=1 Tax=Acidovorax sp. TaxID=1872122 RepID=UPI0025C29262|nr:hypothetical protein [Acidovorax sp.]